MHGLRKVRTEKGMTLTRVAGLANVAYPTLAWAETRGLRLLPHQVQAVAEVLEVDPMDVRELRAAMMHGESSTRRSDRAASPS